MGEEGKAAAVQQGQDVPHTDVQRFLRLGGLVLGVELRAEGGFNVLEGNVHLGHLRAALQRFYQHSR